MIPAALSKKVKELEAKSPTTDRRSRDFLAKLSYEELCILHDIVERKDAGIAPTDEEKAYCDDLTMRYGR